MAILLTLITGCRDEADYLRNYGQNDYLNFAEAEKSYANQFDALWTALNCNYALWDYEEACGLDWDKVYTDYMPKFRELDERDSTLEITNEEVEALYKEAFSPLHDGHLYIQVQNLRKGDFIDIRPNYYRNMPREDYDLSLDWVSPALFHYSQLEETHPDRLVNIEKATTDASDILKPICYEAYDFVHQQADSLENLSQKTDLDQFRLDGFRQAEEDFGSFLELPENRLEPVYGELRDRYSYLDQRLLLPVFYPYDEDLRVYTGCFADGIPYLQFNSFAWLKYMHLDLSLAPSSISESYAMGIKMAWLDWYQTVAALHQTGQLKGVIIDLRSNGGGYNSDFQYILGALLPPGGIDVGYQRFKTGTGRLDYSPLMPAHFDSLGDANPDGTPSNDGVGLPPLAIEAPIVVLTNCWSCSMSEITTAAVKLLPNGCQIGTTTWGGFSSLLNKPELYSFSYASSVGVRDVTCFYANIPATVTTTIDHQYVDGNGLVPDIVVSLDRDLLEREGRDNQLERALQYIRTGQ